MKGQIPRAFGSVLLLLGAFAVGGVLHEVLVEGTLAPGSPLAVGGGVVGVLLIAVGLRLEREFDPSEYVPAADEEEEAEEDEHEEWSPVTSEMLQGREADEEYEER